MKVAVSGGFDPLHAGHINYIHEAKKLGDYLTVILNGDNFLLSKKGYFLMPQEERKIILEALKDVDEVVLINPINDDTALEGLKIVKPDIFAKGGDRTGPNNIPEWNYCLENNIKIITNVGGEKTTSSQQIINKIINRK